jgi:hypothetical protein
VNNGQKETRPQTQGPQKRLQMRRLPTQTLTPHTRPDLVERQALDEKGTTMDLALLITDYGIANATSCIQASREPNRPTLPRCLALLENESMGRNVFGGEEGACPPEWLEQEVTQHRYTIYKLRRDKGEAPNGVGPTQLTDPTLQITAEKAGGCWIPLHNMQVGFAFLHGLIEREGTPLAGARAYNGTGPAADQYALRFIERASIWEDRLRPLGLS